MKPFCDDKAAVEANIDIIDAMDVADVKRYITWATQRVKSSEDKNSIITIVPGIMASLFLPKAKKNIKEIVADVHKFDLE